MKNKRCYVIHCHSALTKDLFSDPICSAVLFSNLLCNTREQSILSISRLPFTPVQQTDPLQPFHVLHQEPICIVPRQKHIFDNVANAFLLETEVVGTDHWGVHQIQSATRTAAVTLKLYRTYKFNSVGIMGSKNKITDFATAAVSVSKYKNKELTHFGHVVRH